MRPHGIVAAVRRITGELTSVKKIGKIPCKFLADTTFGQSRGDVVLADFRHVHVQFVGNKSDESLVKLLIESRVEILVKIAASLRETFLSHLRGAPVLCSGDISPQGSHLSERKEDSQRTQNQDRQEDPEQHGTHKERPRGGQARFAGEYETYVVCKTLHILTLDTRIHRHGRRRISALTLSHLDVHRLSPECHVLAGVYIVVGIFHRLDREITVASWDERILERLAAGRAAGALVRVLRRLRVIGLEIRREADLRFFKKRDIAASGDRNDQRGRVMSLEVVRCQTRGYSEITHASSE